MEYKKLLMTEASPVEIANYVVGGEMASVTIRIPRNLRDSAKEAAAMRGMSLSAFIRNCLIQELTEEVKRNE